MKPLTYAFDFDGVLAEFDEWKGIHHTGKPVDLMVAKAKNLLAMGHKVIIFTARITPGHEGFEGVDPVEAVKVVEEWCQTNIGQTLPVTNIKGGFDVLYDDIAVQVPRNSGRTLQEVLLQKIEDMISISSIDNEYYCTQVLRQLAKEIRDVH